MVYSRADIMEILMSNEGNRVLYFTSETGKQAHKNAEDNFKGYCGRNPHVEWLGVYDGPNFAFDDYDVIDGDSIYILLEEDSDYE